MHVQNKYSWIKHIDFMAINLFSLIACFAVSFYLKFGNWSQFFTSTWQALLLILCLANIVLTLILNPYSGILRRPYYMDAIKLFLLTLYLFIIIVIFFYLFKIGALYSRVTLVATFVSYYIVSLLLLYIRKKLILSGKIQLFNVRQRSLLAVINLSGLDAVIDTVDSNEIREYEIAGFCFPDDECDEDSINGKPVIRRKDLVNYVLNNHIDDVYISVAPGEFSAAEYKALVDNGVNVQLDIESLIGIQTDDQFISNIGGYTTLTVGPYAMDSNQAFYLIVKRVLDIFFGIIGVIILIPMTIIVKIAYLLTGDTAPIFYTHERIGQYGKPFQLIKYRSMVPNADEVLKELLKQEKYRKEWEQNQKFEKDPRITKVGRFLRKTSLDEFPQFINVIKGEMSVVGPRPLIRGELEEHNGLTLYNKVRPGVTGWWACNGRSNIKYKERLELEYFYVKNCSLYLDALCIFRSVFAVIHRDGAQ